jgi:4-azaleucine resistance transporter AzlC
MEINSAQSTLSNAPPATFAQGIIDSFPIVIGYVPIAFAFGLTAVKLGFSPWESTLFSMLIYAGASQFVITALLSAGMSIWLAALTVMAMDVRHVLYGPSLKNRIPSPLSHHKTALWAFGLTDEVFAAATARLIRSPRQWSENWMCAMALTAWSSWVAGTVAGSLLGNGALQQFPAIEAALSFMLPALFLSFLLAAFQRQHSKTFAFSLMGALAGLLLSSIPMAILFGIAAGCLSALLHKPLPIKDEP